MTQDGLEIVAFFEISAFSCFICFSCPSKCTNDDRPTDRRLCMSQNFFFCVCQWGEKSKLELASVAVAAGLASLSSVHPRKKNRCCCCCCCCCCSTIPACKAANDNKMTEAKKTIRMRYTFASHGKKEPQIIQNISELSHILDSAYMLHEQHLPMYIKF